MDFHKRNQVIAEHEDDSLNEYLDDKYSAIKEGAICSKCNKDSTIEEWSNGQCGECGGDIKSE